MRILYINIFFLVIIFICHFIIIIEKGRNNFMFDILLFATIISMIILNIYTIVHVFKQSHFSMFISLGLSLIYYILLFLFPLFEGSR
jgi:hypothetical protein